MDMTHLTTMMTASISEVMETMFYIPVEPQEAGGIQTCGFPDGEEVMACSINFSGSFSGTLYIFIPRALLMVITENFIGEPGDVLTDEHLIGTLKETLNMIAGNTFSKIDPNASFGLGVPEMDPGLYDKLCNNGGASFQDSDTTGFFVINTMDGDMAVAAKLS